MSENLAPVAELAALIEEVSGNVIPPGHYPFLAETARQRAVGLHLGDVQAYVTALARGELTGEWSRLLPHVTVKESFLFRHPQQFAALATTILPALAAARAGWRSLAVWSAGCARGEEPATLAIVLAEAGELAGWDWRIVATDVDEEALAAAASGSFGARAVAHVPAELRARYLLPRGEAYALAPELARRIEYRALNLVRAPLGLPVDPFDLVFLRNVLIYFRADMQRRVAATVASVLARDGRLFLGPAETLWQVSADLEPIDLGDCFCYAHAGERQLRAVPPTAPGPAVEPQPAVAGSGAGGAGSRPAAPAAPTRPHPAGHGEGGTQERLAAAARHIAASRLEDAADLVGLARLADPSDPGVHAVEGFLHDLSGRTPMAVAAYRAALFLEPPLFQVRLLLADALRRLGHERRAETEYREVLATLAGRAVEIGALEALAWPDCSEALRRARAALHGGGPSA